MQFKAANQWFCRDLLRFFFSLAFNFQIKLHTLFAVYKMSIRYILLDILNILSHLE